MLKKFKEWSTVWAGKLGLPWWSIPAALVVVVLLVLW
jgi:hypothetical protein